MRTLFGPGLTAYRPVLPRLDIPLEFLCGEKDLDDWCDARNVSANIRIRHVTFLTVFPGANLSAYREHAPLFADKLFDALDAILGDE